MKDRFSTQDFYSGCLIRAAGFPLINVVKVNGKFCTFHFGVSSEECESILRKHWDRSLMLPTKDVIDAINELKTRIYSI